MCSARDKNFFNAPIIMFGFNGGMRFDLNVCYCRFTVCCKVLTLKIKLLINVFAENEHSITVLENVTKEYLNNSTTIKEK